jgi:hypothetical protein
MGDGAWGIGDWAIIPQNSKLANRERYAEDKYRQGGGMEL